MTAIRACFATLALLTLATLGPGASVCSAQPFPQVREVRAHRANYSARSRRTIRRIVLHTIEGSEQAGINTFKNPRSRVSAHYLVSKRGRITRLVPDMSIAHHVRHNNSDTIGIENEGYASRNGWTTAQYEALANLVRALCDRYRIPKDRRHILGHNELDRRRRVDPGRYFDWTRFMALVRGRASSGGASVSTGIGAAVDGVGAAVSGGRSIVEVTADDLNVRRAPNGQVLGHVHRGARFVASARSGGWTRIDWRGREAWVSSRYLRGASGTIDVVRVSALNVRAGPSTSSGRLGQLSRDQAYVRLARRGLWVLIQFDDRRAWVHSAYTRAQAGATP